MDKFEIFRGCISTVIPLLSIIFVYRSGMQSRKHDFKLREYEKISPQLKTISRMIIELQHNPMIIYGEEFLEETKNMQIDLLRVSNSNLDNIFNDIIVKIEEANEIYLEEVEFNDELYYGMQEFNCGYCEKRNCYKVLEKECKKAQNEFAMNIYKTRRFSDNILKQLEKIFELVKNKYKI
ncbi:MAG: hypothetical protein LBN08_02555 [Lactobacillales bacterium]|nr:hypothetical protein [Lactobacillales bacterium]